MAALTVVAMVAGFVVFTAGPASAAICETSGPGAAYSVTVCFTSPAPGSTATGAAAVTTTVQVTGTNPGIAKMVYWLDGNYLLTDYEAPFTFELPTQTFADGPMTITAAASMRDNFLSTSASVTITSSNGNSTAPANTSTFSPKLGTTPSPGSPYVLALVGDAAAGRIEGNDVVNLLTGWNPNHVLYLGDVYEDGTFTEFYNWYGHDGSAWSRFKDITNPTRGNHETSGGVASGYDYYWNNPPKAFSYNANGWHFISLDVHDTASFDTAQRNWLLSDLAANSAQCTVAFFHVPVLSLGPQGSSPALNDLWSLLVDNGVDLVLQGHEHNYQRFVPLDRSLNASPTGVPQFTIGSSGHGIRATTATDPRAAFKADTVPAAFGAMKMELNPAGANFYYVNTANTTLDSGAIGCSGATDTTAPAAPTGVNATATSGFQAQVSWSAAADNAGITGYKVFRNSTLVGTTQTGQRSFTDTTVAPNTTYTYTVTATDPAGNESAPSTGATVTTPAAPTTMTLNPTDDAYVDATAAGANFGQAMTLRADTSPLQRSFLRFDVSQLGGSVTSSSLRLRPNANLTAGVDIYAVPSSAWSESMITDATAPAVGNLIATSGPLSANTYVSINLGSTVTGLGQYSFAVIPKSSTAVPIASGETATPPELVINTNPTVNQPPVAVDDTATTVAGVAVSVPVLVNDTDPESNPLTVQAVTQGANGAVALSGTQAVTYTPSSGFSGTDTFTYTVSDGNATDTGLVTVTVTPATNEVTVSPTDDSYVATTTPGANFGSAADLRADTSPDTRSYLKFNVSGLTQPVTKAILRLSAITSHSTGITVNDVNDDSWQQATLTYANAPAVSPTIAASSGPLTAGSYVDIDVTSLISGNGTHSLALLPKNSTALRISSKESFAPPLLVVSTALLSNGPPVALDDTAAATVTNPVTVSVLANDSDPESSALTVTAVTQGANGSAAISGGGQTVTYTAATGFTGVDTFTYTVSDGNLTDTGTVTVTVNPAVTMLTLTPTDDAYVTSANPSSNFGATSDLRADTSPTQLSYLKFDVSGLAGSVTSAKLRLMADVTHSAGFNLQVVPSTTWTQSTITYSNAPTPNSAIVATSGRLTGGNYLEIDVTSVVQANGQFAFAVVPINTTALRLSSKETATPPQLVVTTSTS